MSLRVVLLYHKDIKVVGFRGSLRSLWGVFVPKIVNHNSLVRSDNKNSAMTL